MTLFEGPVPQTKCISVNGDDRQKTECFPCLVGFPSRKQIFWLILGPPRHKKLVSVKLAWRASILKISGSYRNWQPDYPSIWHASKCFILRVALGLPASPRQWKMALFVDNHPKTRKKIL